MDSGLGVAEQGGKQAARVAGLVVGLQETFGTGLYGAVLLTGNGLGTGRLRATSAPVARSMAARTS